MSNPEKEIVPLSSTMGLPEMESYIRVEVENGKNYDEMVELAHTLDDPKSRANFLAEARRQVVQRTQDLNTLWKYDRFRNLRERFRNLEEYPRWLEKELDNRRSLKVLYADTKENSFALVQVVGSNGHKNTLLLVDETVSYEQICKIANHYESHHDIPTAKARVRAFLLERNEIAELCEDADDRYSSSRLDRNH